MSQSHSGRCIEAAAGFGRPIVVEMRPYPCASVCAPIAFERKNGETYGGNSQTALEQRKRHRFRSLAMRELLRDPYWRGMGGKNALRQASTLGGRCSAEDTPVISSHHRLRGCQDVKLVVYGAGFKWRGKYGGRRKSKSEVTIRALLGAPWICRGAGSAYPIWGSRRGGATAYTPKNSWAMERCPSQ